MVTNEYILAEKLGTLLLARHWKVAVAESCTGGGLAHAFTSVPGSSAWFELGVVSYSNRMKTAMLNVSESLLARYGAVSEEVAAAMLQGVLAKSGADIGMAVSGIAGPSGGLPNKPVGMVCFAWGSLRGICTDTVVFSGDREGIRSQSVNTALEKLIEFAHAI